MSSLLRSTKFVRYFAGAARTLILNSGKSAETNLLINPKALVTANSIQLKDYSTSKKAESLEPLLQRLDSEVRRYGRISKRDIDEVFDEIRIRNNITSTQSLLVIRCCGELVPEELPEQRTLLVQKIWSVLTERGVPMDISHYNALLRVYIENEHPFSPAEFLKELEQKGLQPNRVTYQRLMWRYCQEGDVEGATKVLEKMRELKLPVSEPVLNALVMGHAFHGDTDGAKAVLNTMAGAGLLPSNRTYTLLACGFAKKGDLDGIENVLKTASDSEALVTDKDILDIIEQLAVSGHGDKIDSLLKHLQKGFGYVTEVCNLILRLINKGQDDIAKDLLKTFPNPQNQENSLYRGAFFIKQLFKVKRTPEAIVNLCNELQKENLVPHALYIATEAALQHGNTEVALTLFKEIKNSGMEIRQHYYWPLLVAKGREKDEEGLLQVLRDMTAEKLTPSSETLRVYVIPYLYKNDTPQNVLVKLQIANVPRLHAARSLMVQLLEDGKISDASEIAKQYRPFAQYSLVRPALIQALNKTKDVESFVSILHITSSKSNNEETNNEDITEDKDTITEISRTVVSAVKNIPADLCENLLETLHSKGLRINTNSAEAIEQYLGKDLTCEISEKLAKLISTNLELSPLESPKHKLDSIQQSSASLERLLELKKGTSYIARYQKQLLTAYIQENNVDKLTSLVNELESQNFELTNSTIAQLFEFYAQNDDIEKALHYKKILDAREPKFLLNKFKIVQLAYAYIKANKYDEAVAFLRENRQEDSENNFSYALNSKCWQTLNTLAESKNTEAVKDFTKHLIENNYMEPSNVLLGPSIKVHLLNDDLEGALNEFENCCKQYRCTPWKGELMKSLIMKEDATKLQWLADLSTQIHGEVNILHDLVLAFIECGRLRQARRILETPGMQTRQKRLDDACERYVQEGKSEHLEGLLEATKDLSYIDRSNIYFNLLQTYCKANEPDKALGLWTVLQEEGEVPTEKFLNHLGKYLKANNREVPFAMAETKKVPFATAETKEVPFATAETKEVKKQIKAQPKLTKSDVVITRTQATTVIDNFIDSEQYTEAADAAIKYIKQGINPKPNCIKYTLKKLAESANVKKILEFGSIIDNDKRKLYSYDDKLTLAKFNAGDSKNHIEELYQSVGKAKDNAELEEAITKFPRSYALSSIIDDNNLAKKCEEIAVLCASRGQYLPANLLWMEYLLHGKDKEADNLWKNHLVNSNSVAYRRLAQESHTRNQPQLLDKLVTYLKSNKNIPPTVLGNAYSRLISIHVAYGNTEDAKLTLDKALSDGLTINNITGNTLNKLKSAVEGVGQNLKQTIPE